jgi:putative ABC transport system permease protein
MGLNVCVILGQSLNISSQKIFDSQTIGHNYEFDTQYAKCITDTTLANDLPYLYSTADLSIANYDIEQTVIGLYRLNELYELKSTEGNLLPVPNSDNIYINPGLADTYGVHIGDVLTIKTYGIDYDFTVAGIATNARSASIFVNASQLSEMMVVPNGSYNGIWSMKKLSNGGTTIDKALRIDNLKKNAVSSNTSAVINQIIGVVVGCILLFLALYANFQDNLQDMLILNLMGYKSKEIRKMLIDVYRPIVWSAFLLTIFPSILTAKAIQKSLSIATNDYMPFGTSIIVVLLLFILLNIIYWLVQSIFSQGIKRTIRKVGEGSLLSRLTPA